MNTERRTLLSLFLSSVAVLLFEMIQIRVFSYSLTPILAYTAISLSMTGFGIGAMLLSLVPSLGQADVRRSLGLLALLQSVAMVLSCALLARVSWGVIASFEGGVLPLLFEVLLPSTVPYFFTGLFLAIVFRSAAESVGKVYFWNLLGSGLGCIVIVLALVPLGGEAIIMVSAALSALAALVLVVPSHRALAAASGAVLALELAATAFAPALFPFAPDPLDTVGYGIRNAQAAGAEVPRREWSEWNVVGRVEVWGARSEKVRIPETLDVRVLAVDAGGTTQLIADGGKEGWGDELFGKSLYGVAYAVKPHPGRVLVIGTGGGIDVQAALHAGARHVTAIEINESTIHAVKGAYAKVLKWPTMGDRVVLRHDDGRSFVKATKERFDVIQMSGVDTITVYATGSINMNEDSLYTVDAFEDYLSILRPGGIYCVLRVGTDYVRLSAMATEALLRLGVKDPARHLLAFKQGGASGVIVKREAISEADKDGLERMAARREPTSISVPHFKLYGYRIEEPVDTVYVPGRKADAGYKRYFEIVRKEPWKTADLYERLSIDVPTDDNPYYMLQQMMRAVSHSAKFKETFSVLKTFWAAIIVLAVVLILVPVAVLRRNAASTRPMAWVLPYFFGIGACFMLLEICIIHIFTIFVGSPGASIAVVMTSLLIFSGVGAYATGLGSMSPLRRILIATGVLVAASLALVLLSDPIFNICWSLGLGQIGRAVVTGLFIAPMGLAMGWFFPSGLRAIGRDFEAPQLVPWAVSVNGFASVLGSIVAMPLSMYHGFKSVFALGIVGYVCVALVSLAFLGRKLSPDPRP
jgi:SAM-dependent methyltransferase